MTYSVDTNVLSRINHVKVPSGVLISEFRDDAFNEINIQIRKLYTVPVVSTDDTDMGFLKSIEADLAGGKLLLDISTVQEIDSLHEFGMELIKRSSINISKIIAESIVLIGAEKDTDSSDTMVNFPSITLKSPDDYDNFNRKPSGIQQDAANGRTNSHQYNSLEDTFDDNL
jgi:hypothetical protein